MALVMTGVFSLIYLAGFYGSHYVNLLFRRVLLSNRRWAGLGFLGAAAVYFYYIFESRMPEGLTDRQRGEIQGEFVLAPLLIVVAFIVFKIWRENRAAGKPGKN